MLELCQSGVVLRQWWWDNSHIETRATYGDGWPTFTVRVSDPRRTLRRLLSIRLRWRGHNASPWLKEVSDG